MTLGVLLYLIGLPMRKESEVPRELPSTYLTTPYHTRADYQEVARLAADDVQWWESDGTTITAIGGPVHIEAPLHVGATEEWSPQDEYNATTDAWLEAMNEEDARFLADLDHKFVKLLCPDYEVDQAYEQFVQDSMHLPAYRAFRLEHTGEFSTIL